MWRICYIGPPFNTDSATLFSPLKHGFPQVRSAGFTRLSSNLALSYCGSYTVWFYACSKPTSYGSYTLLYRALMLLYGSYTLLEASSLNELIVDNSVNNLWITFLL